MKNKESLVLVRNGDKLARERLISENTGLVWSIVRRFNSRGYDAEDLFYRALRVLKEKCDMWAGILMEKIADKKNS